MLNSCNFTGRFTADPELRTTQNGVSVTGFSLAVQRNYKDGPCGKTLEPFCDKIYHSKELTEDEIAQQILKQKAS